MVRVFTVSAILFIAVAGVEVLADGGCSDSRTPPPGLTLSEPWMPR